MESLGVGAEVAKTRKSVWRSVANWALHGSDSADLVNTV